jgi:hypothetical protein
LLIVLGPTSHALQDALDERRLLDARDHTKLPAAAAAALDLDRLPPALTSAFKSSQRVSASAARAWLCAAHLGSESPCAPPVEEVSRELARTQHQRTKASSFLRVVILR